MSKYAIISGFSTVWRIAVLTRRQKCKYVIIMTLLTMLLLLLCATGIKWLVDNIWHYKYQYNPRFPCDTMREASDDRLMVSEVTWIPKAVNINGFILQIGESWIEREVERGHFMIWLRQYKETGNYHFCFRLEKGRELFHNQWPELAFHLRNDVFAVYSPYFTSIEGSNGILFFVTINTSMVFHDTITVCVPDPILCRPDAPPLAQFQVTSK